MASFTLTMWDVKSFVRRAMVGESRTFYLNYVGCKEIFNASDNLTYYSFTLTMWDVKFLSQYLSKTSNIRFTLTMWDVKIFSKVSVNHSCAFYLNYVGCKVRKRSKIVYNCISVLP